MILNGKEIEHSFEYTVSDQLFVDKNNKIIFKY